MIDESMEFLNDGSIKYMDKKRELHILIPKYYEKFQMIKVDADVQTLGIFELWYDQEMVRKQFFLPAMITMCPSEILYQTIDGDEYVYCTFRAGDIFMKTKNVVKTEYIAYALFSMYLEKGKIPELITYDKSTFMFDIVAEVTGSKIKAFNHAIFETIYSHLARDSEDVQKPYRLTDMKKPPIRLKLSDLPHVTTSVTAKLESGYLQGSINVALTHDNEVPSKIEELLRQ